MSQLIDRFVVRAELQQFPWRTDTQATLHIDGEAFFPAMLAAIGAAQHFVLLEMYLFESGSVATRFIDAFCEARKRNVEVFFILDDFGCRALLNEDRMRLTTAGIDIYYYNPFRYGRLRRSMFRDHRKILIVDSEVAYVGGAGLTDEFDNPTYPEKSWRETMVEVRGSCILDWQALFFQTWRQHSNRLPSRLMSETKIVTGIPGRVTHSSSHGPKDHKRSLVKRLRTAERQIWLATGYFLPSLKIRRALKRAAQSGVDVRLLLPGEHTDHPAVRHAGRRFYNSLLKSGVRLFEYQPRFTHSKVIMADYWVSIGSSNIDRWNLRWNLEANQELESEVFAQKVVSMFENDFLHCNEITLSDWQRRPRYRRLLEWFWGKIDVLLVRITRH